jgi:hypothetical protein
MTVISLVLSKFIEYGGPRGKMDDQMSRFLHLLPLCNKQHRTPLPRRPLQSIGFPENDGGP